MILVPKSSFYLDGEGCLASGRAVQSLGPFSMERDVRAKGATGAQLDYKKESKRQRLAPRDKVKVIMRVSLDRLLRSDETNSDFIKHGSR